MSVDFIKKIGFNGKFSIEPNAGKTFLFLNSVLGQYR